MRGGRPHTSLYGLPHSSGAERLCLCWICIVRAAEVTAKCLTVGFPPPWRTHRRASGAFFGFLPQDLFKNANLGNRIGLKCFAVCIC